MKVRLIVFASFLLQVAGVMGGSAVAQGQESSATLYERASRLEAQGKWQEAVPLLEQVVRQEPTNSAALYKLGSMKSWQAGGRNEALGLLLRACDLSSGNPEYCGAYAELLSWNSQTRAGAVARLQQILAAHPEAVSARLRLAQIWSWSDATRPQAMELYEQGLKRDPENVELLIGSGDVLSWSSTGRAKALVRYDQVLQENPDEVRALTGKAQLLSWRGLSTEALVLYDRALAKDPKNVAALRGKAEILNWKGHYAEARSLAKQAQAAEPSDARARLELARANVGLHKYEEARQAIADVGGTIGPGFADTRQDIHRGLGTYVELGYSDRRERDLAYDRFGLSVSTPLTPGNRLTFTYRPTLFDGAGQGFNTNDFAASLDSETSDKLTSHFQVGAETFNNAPVNFNGGADVRYKPVSSTVLKFAFLRQPVEESRLSRRGFDVGGLFLGQVQTNLATLGVSYYNSAHKYDMYVDYTDGVYTGQNLDANRRYSFEGQVGKSLRSDRPYVRMAYGVNYTSFAHDADVQSALPLSSKTGGYFSPTRYLLNQGVLSMSHHFRKDVGWDATATAGVQNVETDTASFANRQFAYSAGTHLFWRATPMNDLTFGYEYLNVFNALNRHLYQFTCRHYF